MTDKPSPLAISVMLVDDHPVMRVGLANVLSINHGFRIVAQADDGPSAIDLWRRHRPDVCLLDVSMERMDGIETLRRLRAEFPEARVLMLTSSKAGEDMALAMQSGSLTLTGLNTFTGSSAVLSGAVLKLDGQINNTTLSVAGGATLMGSGTILGTTTIAGLHAPGSSPGIQTLGNLSYLAGASVQWELWNNTINNAVTPPDYDQILLTGNLDFSGATTFNLAFSGSAGPTNYSEVAWANTFWAVNREWLVYDVAGTTTGFGDLSLNTINWADSTGASFNTARLGSSFQLAQRDNKVYLVYTIPEPGTLALAAIGLAAAAWAARRRAQHSRG